MAGSNFLKTHGLRRNLNEAAGMKKFQVNFHFMVEREGCEVANDDELRVEASSRSVSEGSREEIHDDFRILSLCCCSSSLVASIMKANALSGNFLCAAQPQRENMVTSSIGTGCWKSKLNWMYHVRDNLVLK